MNFNLVLDYFNKKGKVRSWEKTIHLALVSNANIISILLSYKYFIVQ